MPDPRRHAPVHGPGAPIEALAQARWSSRDRWGVVVSGFVVALGSVLLASSGWFSPASIDGPRGGSPITAADEVAPGVTWWPAGQRVQSPVLAGRALGGEWLSTRQWHGRVVVLNAWGSWCAPCRAEAPDLRRVATATWPRGVRFLGIDTRDNRAAARAFVRRYQIPYPSLFDESGSLLLALADTVPARAIPSTVVVDQKGRVAARVIGRVRASTLRGLIDDVLEDRPRRTEPADPL